MLDRCPLHLESVVWVAVGIGLRSNRAPDCGEADFLPCGTGSVPAEVLAYGAGVRVPPLNPSICKPQAPALGAPLHEQAAISGETFSIGEQVVLANGLYYSSVLRRPRRGGGPSVSALVCVAPLTISTLAFVLNSTTTKYSRRGRRPHATSRASRAPPFPPLEENPHRPWPDLFSFFLPLPRIGPFPRFFLALYSSIVLAVAASPSHGLIFALAIAQSRRRRTSTASDVVPSRWTKR